MPLHILNKQYSTQQFQHARSWAVTTHMPTAHKCQKKPEKKAGSSNSSCCMGSFLVKIAGAIYERGKIRNSHEPLIQQWLSSLLSAANAVPALCLFMKPPPVKPPNCMQLSHPALLFRVTCGRVKWSNPPLSLRPCSDANVFITIHIYWSGL